MAIQKQELITSSCHGQSHIQSLTVSVKDSCNLVRCAFKLVDFGTGTQEGNQGSSF